MKKKMIDSSIIIKSNHWPRRQKKMKEIINSILKQKKLFYFSSNIDYYFNFILCNDLFIKKYNRIYRKNDKSTDILTFISEIKKKNKNNQKHCDIILSANTAIKDAKKNNINFYNHVIHLLVHSLLHISGYTHYKNDSFIKMKNKEIKILKHLGISNPYN